MPDNGKQPREKVRVGSGHRITIPQHFQQKHEINEGDFVYISPSKHFVQEKVSEEVREEIREEIEEAYGFTSEF